MGLELTKDVILRNRKAVFEAHLRAAEVEFELALEVGAWDHLRKRLKHARDWCDDPFLPAELRERSHHLYSRTKAALPAGSH